MTGMAVVVATDAPVGLVLALSALSAAALAPYRPAAGALTPEVVGEKDLAAANSIFSALENLVVVVGPGIGGLLLLTGQPVIGVAINAASFVVAAALIARLRVRSRGGGEDEGSAAAAVDGRAQGAGRAARRAGDHPVLRPGLRRLRRDAPSCTSRCRSGWAPAPTATATCWPASALGGVLGAGLANRLSSASRLAPVIMGSICLQALPFLVTVPVTSPRWPALCRSSPASG